MRRSTSWDSRTGAVEGSSAAKRTGWRRDRDASWRTSSVMVAENSTVCRALGASRTTSPTCNQLDA